jgi:hypothetical protein
MDLMIRSSVTDDDVVIKLLLLQHTIMSELEAMFSFIIIEVFTGK